MKPVPSGVSARAPFSPFLLLVAQMADFYEDKQLTLKQFLVVLAIGYVLDAIPDLLEVTLPPVVCLRVPTSCSLKRSPWIQGFVDIHNQTVLNQGFHCVLDPVCVSIFP